MIVKSIIHIILCPYKNGLIYEVYLYAILGNGEENSGSDMETEQGTFSCREESYLIMMMFFLLLLPEKFTLLILYRWGRPSAQ